MTLSVPTGQALKETRERLTLTQETFAAVLGISLSSLKRAEKAPVLDTTLSLAAECLLRREHMRRTAPVTPEERAERKHAERKALAALHAADPVPRAGALVPAEELARRQVTVARERRRIRLAEARNNRRDEDRPRIASLHVALKAMSVCGDWVRYREALAEAQRQTSTREIFLQAYLDAASTALPADADPLVTLPLESV